MKRPMLMMTIIPLFFTISSEQNSKSNHKQPKLVADSVDIIKKDGLEFKDLNKNGVLDPYEDWRLSPKQRSQDLLSRMSPEEKAGMLLIADMRMQNERFMLEQEAQSDPITTEFNEEDVVVGKNQFTGETLPFPVMQSIGTTKGVTEHHLRHFIWRTTNTPADTMAIWANKVQALAESTPLGIPVLFASNPRNHITGGSMGVTASASVGFSKWPSEIGLAAMKDKEMVKTFADMARQEWLAVGMRKGYMYMADLATEPRWQRIEGTFGEDPQLAADCIDAVVRGFQGDSLGNHSVALTTKHFPGGGATEKGFDPHYTYGRNAVFPGDHLEKNLLPFKAAIAAGTSSIMPYYSLPKGTQYEEVAYAYNEGILRRLLRTELGFQGIINSDTGPIESMPWGVEELSIEERYEKALQAGTNMFAGNADPQQLLSTMKNNPHIMQFVDESVLYLLKELFQLGLFENPYVEEDKAMEVVGKKEFVEKGKEAQRKSIVLLRNEQGALPLESGTKVYFEDYQKSHTDTSGPGDVYDQEYEGLEFVQTPEDADVILIWLKPSIRPLFPANDAPLEVKLSSCGVDTDYINQLTGKKPSILVVNYSNPFAINEIYNEETQGRFKGVLATFGVEPEALLDVVTGKFNPSGKMPFTTPKNQEVVETNKEDVPGYDEGPNYALFSFGEGETY